MSRKIQEIVAGRCRCPAKINFGLRILGRRDDGYHLLESAMLPIDVVDVLEVRVSAGGATRIELEVEGGDVPAGTDNLVCRAAAAFLDAFRLSARVDLRLTKTIPSGAGLGGGSSDAAATFRLLDGLLGVNAGESALRELALDLGADVPFFVSGRPALVTGIGEISTPLTKWPDGPLVVAFQGAGLATPEVYAAYDASLTSPQSASTIPDFPHASGAPIRNDLEAAASRIDPGIIRLKEALLSNGASDVGMSGSGSAVFGLFRDEAAAQVGAERLSRKGIWARATRILSDPLPIERIQPDLS